MIKIFIWSLKISFIIAIALWFGDNPGYVRISWLDWSIETSFAMMLLLIAIVVFNIYFLLKFLRHIWTAPKRYRQWRQQRNRQSALHKLANAYMFKQMGDDDKSNQILHDTAPALSHYTLWSLLKNDHDAIGNDKYQKQFMAYAQANDLSAQGDYQKALDILLKMHHQYSLYVYPKPTMLLCRLALLCQYDDEAHHAFDKLQQKFKKDPIVIRFCHDHHIMINHSKIRQASTQKNPDMILKLLISCGHEIDHAHMQMAIGVLISNNRHKQATELIEKLWQAYHSVELAALYLSSLSDKDDILIFKHIEAFFKKNEAISSLSSSLYIRAIAAADAQMLRVFYQMVDNLQKCDEPQAQIAYNHLYRQYHHYFIKDDDTGYLDAREDNIINSPIVDYVAN